MSRITRLSVNDSQMISRFQEDGERFVREECDDARIEVGENLNHCSHETEGVVGLFDFKLLHISHKESWDWVDV